MARRVVTLYIDDSSLRLLVAKGKKVEKWADMALEPGLVKDGVISDEAEVAAKIKELLKGLEVRTKKVVAGLTGLRCLTPLISLPQLPKALLAEAIRQETETIMPVPLEQFYLTWQTISARREEKVFVVAVPRNAVDALVNTLRQAGVEPDLMDIKPLALARVVKEATAVIVDVQPTEFDIVIMVDGIPQPIRTQSLPRAAKSWEEKLPIIRQELDRTIKFYDSSHPENPLASDTPVFVSGELTPESLAGELKHPVLPLSSPLKCPPGLLLGRYMANIGLAVKKISSVRRACPSKVNVNALPDVYRPEPPSLINMFVPPIIVVAIGLLAFLFMLIQNTATDTAAAQAELDTLNQLLKEKRAENQLQTEEIGELEKEVSELEVTYDAFATVLDSFDSNHAEVNGDLAVVISTLPSVVKLTSISHATGLAISGTAPSEEEVLAYATALRASGRFSQVIVSNIRRTEGGMSFNFKLSK